MVLTNSCSFLTPSPTGAEERLIKTDDGMSVYQGSISRKVNSQSGTLQLPYLKYSSGEGKPLAFFLSGGPGLSNLKFKPPSSLVKDFDVVLLEYRGVGQSSIQLKSRYFKKLLLKFNGSLQLSSMQPLRPLYLKAFQDLADNGIDFDDFSADALVSDLEALREQLGYSHVHLVAHSFGTRIALKYRHLYPDSVANSVLFSLNTPGGFIWFPKQTMAVLSRYQQGLQQINSDFSQPFDDMLKRPGPWQKRWYVIPVDPGRALFTAFMLSYNRHTARIAYRGLLEAQQGNSVTWLGFDKGFSIFVRTGFNYADLFVKAYLEDCDPDAILLADEQGKDAVFQSPSSVLFAGYQEFSQVRGHCRASVFEPDFTDTLVVSGSLDTSTPLESLPQSLPAEQHIVVQNFGHADALYRDKEKAGQVISNYLTLKRVDNNAFGRWDVIEPAGKAH